MYCRDCFTNIRKCSICGELSCIEPLCDNCYDIRMIEHE